MSRGPATRVPDGAASPRLAVVLGGGGWFGIGFNLGILAGLRDQGVDLDGIPMLGTSAGSWAASASALGVGFETLAGYHGGHLPDPRPAVLARAARDLFGSDGHPDVSAVACRLPGLSRQVLSGRQFPLADLVASSSAVPGLLAPHRVGRSIYVDGGVRSSTSADLAGAADLLVVSVPMGGRVLGWAGSRTGASARGEAGVWSSAHPGRVVLFEPDPVLASSVRLPHQLFDRARASAAFVAARAQARAAALGEVPGC